MRPHERTHFIFFSRGPHHELRLAPIVKVQQVQRHPGWGCADGELDFISKRVKGQCILGNNLTKEEHVLYLVKGS